MTSSINNRLFRTGLALSFALGASPTWAVSVAVIDSGTDFKHADIAPHAWNHPDKAPSRSCDNDTNGWNFSDKNNELIDYSLIGTYSDDTNKYFEIQLRQVTGSETKADRAWLASKRKDAKFAAELNSFANFIHGTHVAGIASRNADNTVVMGAKIISTPVKQTTGEAIRSLLEAALIRSPFESLLRGVSGRDEDEDTSEPSGNLAQDKMMKKILAYAAKKQSGSLLPVGEYVALHKMDVANCSFGTGMSQAKKVVGLLAKSFFKRELTAEEEDKYGAYFMQEIMDKSSPFVTTAPKTLFVVAAGNDGTDNDKEPAFPASLRVPNIITVAATRDYEKLASFSNYGRTSVDIAAPGVGIMASVPSPSKNDRLALSGTSQAAPFVANLVARVMDENPELKIADVKKIVMETVDKKTFLKGKVVSEGIANPARAIHAARASRKKTVDEAIELAQNRVNDVETSSAFLRSADEIEFSPETDGEAVPMPSLFSTEE